MLFWTLIIAAALIAALWIARPFLAKGQLEVNDAEGAISVFRDQIDELERDCADGQISPEERDAARREIEARALKAARDMDGGLAVSHRSLPVAGGLVILTAGVALVAYMGLGAPGKSDQPLTLRKADVLAQRAARGDETAQATLAINDMKDDPETFDDFWALAVSYARIGDYATAATHYRRAAELSDDDPVVLSAYGEAMVLANGNKVPAAARVIFEQVLQKIPDPRARYYAALAKAQAQDFDGAISGWAALAADSDPNAPWMGMVRRDIVNMARFLEVDVTDYLPDASVAEIAQAGGMANAEGATDTPEDLQAAVQADPKDYKAWISLITLHAQSGNAEAALQGLSEARDQFKGAPFLLQRFDEVANDLGLFPAQGDVRGPTAEDIANASDMSKEEQDEMIDGMVAGLAARLEEDPDNVAGWVMLIRSYATLGRADKARASYDAALVHFDGNTPALAQLRSEAGGMIALD